MRLCWAEWQLQFCPPAQGNLKGKIYQNLYERDWTWRKMLHHESIVMKKNLKRHTLQIPHGYLAACATLLLALIGWLSLEISNAVVCQGAKCRLVQVQMQIGQGANAVEMQTGQRADAYWLGCRCTHWCKCSCLSTSTSSSWLSRQPFIFPVMPIICWFLISTEWQ